jgi:hypothetical protein
VPGLHPHRTSDRHCDTPKLGLGHRHRERRPADPHLRESLPWLLRRAPAPGGLGWDRLAWPRCESDVSVDPGRGRGAATGLGAVGSRHLRDRRPAAGDAGHGRPSCQRGVHRPGRGAARVRRVGPGRVGLRRQPGRRRHRVGGKEPEGDRGVRVAACPPGRPGGPGPRGGALAASAPGPSVQAPPWRCRQTACE